MSRKQRPKHVMVVSLGCAKNLVDTEVMCGTLAVAGYQLTNVADDADIMLVNTCSFIADARSEAENEIQAAIRWRQADPSRRLVVSGCLPQRDLQETRRNFPSVDLFLGLDDVPRTAELFDTLYRTGISPSISPAFESPSYIYDSASPRLQLTPRSYAFVKIAEGCDHHCTFCSIPGIRGRQRSRTMSDILAECRMLLDNGVGELNLIAQDTTRYGADMGPGTTLAGLVETLDAELEGDYWIRILYTHPRYFDADLIAVFRNCSHLVPYVDIPLQHLSSPVLKRMGRGIDEQETRDLMQRLRENIDNVALRTTFLVGFPGETDDDFQLLKDYVRTFEFDRLGVFAYSPEPGTAAIRMTEGLVPPEVAAARRDELMHIQRSVSLERNRQMVGQTIKALVEGMNADGQYIGRTVHDAPDVDNLVIFSASEQARLKAFAQVKITAAAEYDLMGVCVD